MQKRHTALALVLFLGACDDTSADTRDSRETSNEDDEGPGKRAEAASPPAAPAVPAPVVYARLPNPSPPLQQQPVTPAPSPKAAIEQTVGVAQVRVDYSSPATKNRDIWGGLVPFNKLWRAGANAPTRIEMSEEATIFGTKVPAGGYSIFIRPTETEWTVILNRDPQNQGAGEHDAAHDVASGAVTPTDAPPRERMTFLFEDTTERSTKLVLDWAGKRAAIPIEFDTPALVNARIDQVVGLAWRPHFNAGRYLLEQEGQQARALELLTKSQQIQATWWNEWFLAKALAANDRKADARAHAEAAQRLGADDEVFREAFAEQVSAALAEWR